MARLFDFVAGRLWKTRRGLKEGTWVDPVSRAHFAEEVGGPLGYFKQLHQAVPPMHERGRSRLH